MNEKVYHWIAFIVIVCVLLAMLRGNNIRTDGAMERIEDDIGTARNRVEVVGERVDNALDAIGRSEEAIGRSEAELDRIEAGIVQCRERVKYCQRLNRQAVDIVESVERANRSRTSGE